MNKQKIIDNINNKIEENIEDIFSSIEYEEDIDLLKKLPSQYKDDEEIMLNIMKTNEIGPLLSYCSDRLKNDPDFVYKTLQINEQNFSQASTELQYNKDFVIKCIMGISRFLIEDAPEEFLDDKDCAIAAIKRKGHHALKEVSERLKDDKDIALIAIDYQPSCYKYISERLKNDKTIVMVAIEKEGSLIKHIPDIYKDDKVVVLNCFNVEYSNYDDQNFGNLQFVSKRLRNDKEIVLKAIKNYPENFKFAGDIFKNDRQFVLEIIKNGGSLEFIGKPLQDDKEIVSLALENSGKQLQFASNRLRNDKTIVLTACSNDIESFQYASQDIREEVGNDNPIHYFKSKDAFENLQDKISNKEKSKQQKSKM